MRDYEFYTFHYAIPVDYFAGVRVTKTWYAEVTYKLDKCGKVDVTTIGLSPKAFNYLTNISGLCDECIAAAESNSLNYIKADGGIEKAREEWKKENIW